MSFMKRSKRGHASRTKSSRKTGTLALYRRLKFGSRATLVHSLARVRVPASNVGALLDTARREAPTRALDLAKGIIGKSEGVGEKRETVRGLVGWAATQTPDAAERRRTVIRAFRAGRHDLMFVHAVSSLGAEEAATFMQTYFAEGGDMQPVVQWLEIAGGALRTRNSPSVRVGPTSRVRAPARVTHASRTPAGWTDPFKDAASAVKDWVVDTAEDVASAVGNLVGGLLFGGKSLSDIMNSVVSWSVDQLTDLVTALIAIGNSVAAILNAALSNGIVKKIVEAVLRAGRSVADVLAWVVQKSGAVVKDVVSAILAAGRTIHSVLAWVAGQAVTIVQKVVQGLLDAGRTVAQVIGEAARLTMTALRKITAAVYQIGHAVGEILAAVANAAANVIRTVLEGLLMIGVTLAKTVAAICADVGAAFRRGFFEGLIGLGYAVLDILKAALAAGAAMLALAFAVVMDLFGGHRSLTKAELTEARRVFGCSIDLARVRVGVASIPADVVNWLNGQRPFTTMYIINFASWAHVEMATLIHELTHVWQGVVTGPVYMVEALHSQVFGRGYDVTDADLAAANGDLRKLEREQQAVVVERYWEARWGGGAWNWQIYEPLARDVYKACTATLPILPIGRPVAIPILGPTMRVPRIALSAIE